VFEDAIQAKLLYMIKSSLTTRKKENMEIKYFLKYLISIFPTRWFKNGIHSLNE